jgi:phospholipid/cholesterol/gamma-HCH transport system permease protein
MRDFSNIIGILWATFASLPSLGLKPIRTLFYRHIYFVGIEAVNRMIILGLIIGGMLIINVVNLVGLSSSVLIGKITVWLIAREVGPLFTAVIIITRDATAIAAELGSMSVTGEIENLDIMGIDRQRYLITPRVASVTLAAVALTLYFEISALLGGYVVASIALDAPFEEFIGGMIASLAVTDLLASLIKSFCFSQVIAATACYQGLEVGNSLTKIPQAITKATSQSLFSVFLLDAGLAFFLP